jgi:type IV secretory pathway VirB4 component
LSKNAKKTEILEEIPKTVSDSIPYVGVYKNGIIEVTTNRFSKSYVIPDVNFKTATDETQYNLAEQWSDFLNTFDNGIDIQLTLYNKTIDMDAFKKKVFLEMKDDDLNEYRDEINEMLEKKMAGAKNNLKTEKYLTITISAENIFIANDKFSQIDSMISDNMATMAKAEVKPMTLIERLSVLNTIYNADADESLYKKRIINGKEVESFTLENCVRQGITTKEVISPHSLEFKSNKMVIGDKIARAYYVQAYPTWIKGTILTDFSKIPCNMLTSVFMSTMDQQEAIKMVKRQGTNISSDILDMQKRASRSGYSADLVSPSLVEDKEESEDLLQGLTKENDKLFVTTFVFTLFAENEDQLKSFETQLKMIADQNLLVVNPLNMQQEDGLATSLPIGNKKITIDRLMTSKTVASIIPFDVLDVKDDHGMYYGLNAASGNLILLDRGKGANYNACILGMPGVGKSFAAKREITNVLLNTDDEVYTIDPEREYTALANELGGSVVKIANGSNIHINPFDLNINNIDDDNSGDPVKVKCDFVHTICEIMIGGKYGLSPIEESIIDRVTINIYDRYLKELNRIGVSQSFELAPTLEDFYNELCDQPQVEAQNMALALERFVSGALDVFSKRTNVEINNRFTVYDIKDIGPGLKELGLQICLDNIWNKMIENSSKGKRTWFYIDEFYLMMQKKTSADYISQIWKRARKWNGYPTAITQNVEDMLKSENARTVINNSSLVMLLSQAPLNRRQLSDMFGLSPTEEKYISSGKSGMGILSINNNIIPFNDDYPKHTKLYKIMSTKPDERIG